MLSAEAARRPRPETEDLRRQLLALLSSSANDGAVLARQANEYATYYDSEVVTLAWPDGRTLRFLIKYDDGEDTMADGLLTVGPSYESQIYQCVLPRLAVAVPRCYGTWRDASGCSMGLVLEYLEGVHAHRTPDRVGGMARAAAFAGRLHALAEAVAADPALPLNTYDAALYTYWAERTKRFERRTRAGQTWLPELIGRIDEIIAMLRSGRQTIIHGDFYPDNILDRDGVVAVFDWEQTAIAPGEIDLASLTHFWHAEVVDAAEDAYRKARWPDGAPSSHYQLLDAARVFVLMRLLGEERGWPSRPVRNLRLDLLRQAAERLELLPS